MIPLKKCDCCNKDLPLGSTKYQVRIDVTSEFDGFLPEESGDPDGCELEQLLEQIDLLSEDELDSDVHVRMEMTLCLECKKRLMNQMEDYAEGVAPVRTKQRVDLH